MRIFVIGAGTTSENLLTLNFDVFCTMQNEIWKDVVGYEGYYKISNLGNVLSLLDRGRWKGNSVLKSGNCHGYRCVNLCRKGSKQKFARIHRLLANAFIPNPLNKPQINHKDGNRTNNNLENLEWCTSAENLSHSYKFLGRNSFKKGTQIPICQKKVIGMNLITGKVVRYDSIKHSRKDGFNTGHVSSCCNHKRKKHKDYIWKFA